LDSIVVVGGGAAGLAAAEALRADGFTGPLTMVCGEPELPYDRPPLSKQVLVGAWEPGRTRFREAAHYAGSNIRLVHGRASSLSLPERAVALGAVTGGKFVALFHRDGVLTAILGWNAAARVPAYRKQLLT
jgi:3-phenylpropionate/trans-cinnamate dioxygenase ferredoxin reductase component